jgi:Sulfotransferase domain
MRGTYQLLRAVPGTISFRRKLRDAAWLCDSDAVIVSYPKSGRTFVRAMLARLYQRKFGINERHLLDFPMLRRESRLVPRVLFTHAPDAIEHPDEPRIARSSYARRKLILLARHPADTAVSRYYHLKHRSRDRARKRLGEQPLETFVCGEGGFPAIVHYLNLFAAIPGVVILRYEDFIADPKGSLEELAAAIGLEVERDDIEDAVEFGKFENLKNREREGYFASARLRRMRRADENSGKVRRGRPGGYRAELSPEKVAWIDDYIRHKLDPRLGYQ